MEIPPNSQKIVPVKSHIRHLLDNEGAAGCVTEPSTALTRDLLMARTAVDGASPSGVLIANLGDHSATIKAGEHLGVVRKVMNKDSVAKLQAMAEPEKVALETNAMPVATDGVNSQR